MSGVDTSIPDLAPPFAGPPPPLLQGGPPGAEAGPLLLVEDDMLIRDVLLEILQVQGFAVVSVETGEQAAALMDDGLKPAVLVTDINLGSGCTGVDLADRMRAISSGTPIVFITGRLDMLRNRGPRPLEFVLPKPFGLNAFVALIKQARAASQDCGVAAGRA